jgi:hypothetical protein
MDLVMTLVVINFGPRVEYQLMLIFWISCSPNFIMFAYTYRELGRFLCTSDFCGNS